MSLGDSFPSNFKSEFASRNIETGTVLRLAVKDTNPPKIKMFIVVGKTIDGLTLASTYINSDINKNINWCIELKNLQIPISEKDYDFLNWDSYVDCSKMISRNTSEITSIIQKNPGAAIGKIKPEDLEAILETLRNAPTIKGKIKKKFGLFS